MIGKILILFERIKNRWLGFYRKKIFEQYTKQKTQGLKIFGNITLINPNVKVGKNVCFYPNCMLFGDGPIVIGDNVDIGNNVIIYAYKNGGGVTIGNNTMIAANSYIIDIDHGIAAGKPMREQENTVGPIIIGEDVWLVTGVTVLKDSKIGNGAVIGAKALVKGEIEENSIAVGIPAKVIKKRS